MFWSTAALLLAALLLGGGPGWFGDRLLVVPALGLGAWACWRLWQQPQRAGWAFWFLPAAVLAVPLLQLIPLPVELVRLLPGRAVYMNELASVGALPTWMAWTLNAFQTERVLWFTVLPVALYFAIASLGTVEQRRLLAGLVAFGVLSALVGFGQAMQGPTSPLYFYSETNPDDAVGFFANRNHLAALLVCLLPLAAGLMSDRIRVSIGSRDVQRWLLAFGLLVLVLGATATRSRAGFGMLLASVVASVLLLWFAPGTRTRWWGSPRAWLQATGLVAAVAVVQTTLYDVLLRFDADPLDDLRVVMARRTWEAAQPFAGSGAGLGTFMDGYGQLGEETADLPLFINHAHNDYVELWFEAGLPGLLLVAVALGVVVYALLQVLRRRAGDDANHGMLLGSGLPLLLLALHSFVDYPLRTAAVASMAAVLAAVLLGPKESRV